MTIMAINSNDFDLVLQMNSDHIIIREAVSNSMYIKFYGKYEEICLFVTASVCVVCVCVCACGSVGVYVCIFISVCVTV